MSDDDKRPDKLKQPDSVWLGSTVKKQQVNSKEAAKKTRKPTTETSESFHFLKHRDFLSKEEQRVYFENYDEKTVFELFREPEQKQLDQFLRDKGVEPDSFSPMQDYGNDFFYNYRDYICECKKFMAYLTSKEQVLGRISEVLEKIEDQTTKTQINEELAALAKSQKIMDFAKEKVGNLYTAILVGELKDMIESGNVDNNGISYIIKEAIESLHGKVDKIGVIVEENRDNTEGIRAELKRLESEYPEGLKKLQEIAYQEPAEKAFNLMGKLLRLKLDETDMHILYYAYFEKLSLREIVSCMDKDGISIHYSTVDRRLNTINGKLKKVDLTPESLGRKINRSY